MADNLTLQEELILAELIADPGLSEARLSKKTKIPRREVSLIMQRPALQRALKDKRDEISGASLITAKRLIEEELHIALSDPADFVDKDGRWLKIQEIPERLRRAIAGIKVKKEDDGTETIEYKLWDKGKALERLEKHIGFFEVDNLTKAPKIVFVRYEEAGQYIDITPKDDEKKQLEAPVSKPVAIMD